MIITVTKMNAARSQLIQAIWLFFEEDDPVSIHTLVGESLEILNDHFSNVDEVKNNMLLFHSDTPMVSNDRRKENKNIRNEAINFFKHAKEDLKKNKNEIEFYTASNDFYIFGAIQCLLAIEKKESFDPTATIVFEIQAFLLWFHYEYPALAP